MTQIVFQPFAGLIRELRAQAAEWLGTSLLKTGDPYAAGQYFRESVLAYANELRDPEYRSDAFFADVALLLFALPDGGGLHADAQELADAIRDPSSNARKVAAAAANAAQAASTAASASQQNNVWQRPEGTINNWSKLIHF